MTNTEIIKKFQLSSRYTEQPNIWEDYELLTEQHHPISLGQGHPNFLPPQYLIDALVQSAHCHDASIHQYTRHHGHPRLVKALSKLYSPLVNQSIDPYTGVVICAGAYGALNASIFGHVQKGDEVIVIDPYFDCYSIMIEAAGGIPRYIPLRLKQKNETCTILSSDWVLDSTELENAFNHKTKAIILNTPHNPFGKVFSKDELLEIANLCEKWNVICISDEVYEWLVYEPKQHIRIASLPGMWERTITVGSAGKTFCITGWKVGWAFGPEHLIKNVQLELRFTPGSIQQETIAIAFETEIARFNQPDCHFNLFKTALHKKRDYMMKVLRDAGMKIIIPDGGIFVVADWTPLETKADMSSEEDVYRDFRFTKWLAKNVGVLGIPISAFYSKTNKEHGENFARFCFIKKDEKLQEAEQAFKKCIEEH